MISLKKMSALAVGMLFTAASATVYAQVPQTHPQPTQSPAMNQPTQSTPPMTTPQDRQQSPFNQNPQPAQQSPDLNQLQKQSSSQEISDKELQEFASVYSKVKEKSQEAQQKMAGVIEKDGMKLDRFNELQRAKMQNQKSDASKEEKKTFKKITKDLDAMQPQLQKDIEGVITANGMTVQRFQTIASAIKSDPDVRSRFQKIMSGGGGNA